MTRHNSLATLALFSFNQERFIAEAVRSALSQDYPQLEIIFSDDHSTDRSFEIIREETADFAGAHKIVVNRMPENVGLAEHLNYVFNLAKGEFIVVAAGDDICFPGKVSALVQPMIDNSEVVGVHSQVVTMTIDGHIGNERPTPDNKALNDPIAVVTRSLAVNSQSHAFRASVHQHFGPFDKNLTNEGKAMAFRESLLGRIDYLDEPQTFYRVGCGVSTYGGEDIDTLTRLEPRKIAAWNSTAIQQIAKDYQKFHELDQDIAAAIDIKAKTTRCLLEINSERWNWRALARSIATPSNFPKTLKAFIRYNAPYILRKQYRRLATKRIR